MLRYDELAIRSLTWRASISAICDLPPVQWPIDCAVTLLVVALCHAPRDRGRISDASDQALLGVAQPRFSSPAGEKNGVIPEHWRLRRPCVSSSSARIESMKTELAVGHAKIRTATFAFVGQRPYVWRRQPEGKAARRCGVEKPASQMSGFRLNHGEASSVTTHAARESRSSTRRENVRQH